MDDGTVFRLKDLEHRLVDGPPHPAEDRASMAALLAGLRRGDDEIRLALEAAGDVLFMRLVECGGFLWDVRPTQLPDGESPIVVTRVDDDRIRLCPIRFRSEAEAWEWVNQWVAAHPAECGGRQH